MKSILEKNPKTEFGIEINLPKIRQTSFEHAIRNCHFNANEFINNEKEHTNSLRFSSGKPTLSKLKVFEKCTVLQFASICINLLVDSILILDELSQWEKDEINILDGVWFVGNASNDEVKQMSNETDFDGEKGRYKWKIGDHINYRFDIG